MRKLILIAAVTGLMAAPVCAQSRHRGYNANGGWHNRASAPVPLRRPEPRKEKQPKANKDVKTPPTVVPPQKS